MSRIACTWVDLGEDYSTNQWFQTTHIPDVAQRLRTQAHHAHRAEENIFKEVPGIQGSSMTVYELHEKDDLEQASLLVDPPLCKLPKSARLETRCYTQCESWFGSEWQDDTSDVRMWIVVLWQPEEAMHDEFVSWFSSEFAPGMLESPELLRTRIFKLEHASVAQNQMYEKQDSASMYQYLTLWEFDCDELPWEVLVYLGGSERWRHYVEGGHLKWQISQYLVEEPVPNELNTIPAPQLPSTSLDTSIGATQIVVEKLCSRPLHESTHSLPLK